MSKSEKIVSIKVSKFANHFQIVSYEIIIFREEMK
jgi:hypothetical protein